MAQKQGSGGDCWLLLHGGGEQTITAERTNATQQKSWFSNQVFYKRGIPRAAGGKIAAAL